MNERTRSKKPTLTPLSEELDRGKRKTKQGKQTPTPTPTLGNFREELEIGRRGEDWTLVTEPAYLGLPTGATRPGKEVGWSEPELTVEETIPTSDEPIVFQREGDDRTNLVPEQPTRAGPSSHTMAQPWPQIDPLVRPRGLPIVVPGDLAPANIPTNLPRFYGSRDEDPSLHMERYIEVLSSSLVVNPGYYLVWFPTTLQGEAYDWYRDHGEGHFVEWPQLQGEFLNHFRPEVGQSAALRAVAAVRQGRDEDISSYVRRFELVCTRFVGNMLNDDTLK